MSSEAKTQEEQSEQLVYAKVLEIGMYLGLVILFVTFGLYVSRAVAPAVPLEQVSNYWSHGVHGYLEAVNDNFLHMEKPPAGWTWGPSSTSTAASSRSGTRGPRSSWSHRNWTR